MVEGDLVFPKNMTVDVDSVFQEPDVEIADHDAAEASGADEGGRGDGDVEVAGAEEDRDTKRAKKTRQSLPEVHVVTKEDVDNKTFALTDVVLPMPG